MKTKRDIEALRLRLLHAWYPFAEQHQLPIRGEQATAEQVHYMGVGAVAMVNAILQQRGPDNLEAILKALETGDRVAELANGDSP